MLCVTGCLIIPDAVVECVRPVRTRGNRVVKNFEGTCRSGLVRPPGSQSAGSIVRVVMLNRARKKESKCLGCCRIRSRDDMLTTSIATALVAWFFILQKMFIMIMR